MMVSLFPTSFEYDDSSDVKYPPIQPSNDLNNDSFYPESNVKY